MARVNLAFWTGDEIKRACRQAYSASEKDLWGGHFGTEQSLWTDRRCIYFAPTRGEVATMDV